VKLNWSNSIEELIYTLTKERKVLAVLYLSSCFSWILREFFKTPNAPFYLDPISSFFLFMGVLISFIILFRIRNSFLERDQSFKQEFREALKIIFPFYLFLIIYMSLGFLSLLFFIFPFLIFLNYYGSTSSFFFINSGEIWKSFKSSKKLYKENKLLIIQYQFIFYMIVFISGSNKAIYNLIHFGLDSKLYPSVVIGPFGPSWLISFLGFNFLSWPLGLIGYMFALQHSKIKNRKTLY
jgi:hypothetical protein